MLDELLANIPFSPVQIAVCAAIAVVCLWFGWIGKGIGARRREKALNRDILEAKASIPQLETAARSRDLNVTRLEEETKELASRSIELARDVDERDKSLRSAERKVRNLTSELAAVKGSSTDNGNMIVDGFEDESRFEDDDSAPTDAHGLLAVKLKKAEALYEKLKDTIIKRDDQIQALEAKLESSQTTTSNDSADTESSDTEQVFQEQLRSHESKIDELTTRLQEIEQEKEMLADMAKRRSESNKSLKEASAAAEGQVTKLNENIETRDKSISDREGSIKRYLTELEELKDERAGREAKIAELSRQVGDHSELTSRDDQIVSLGGDIRASEDRVTTLVAEISSLRTTIENTQASLREREETINEQLLSLSESSAQLEEQLQTANTMQGAIKDRDFKIETLASEVAELKTTLTQAEQQATDVFDTFEKRKEILTVEKTTSQAASDVVSRKAEDLSAQLAQSERWLERMKQTLHDRESQVQAMEKTVTDIEAQNNALASELDEQTQARRSAEVDARTSNRQSASLETKTHQAVSQLKEQDQTIAVLKSTITELEIKVSGSSTDVTR
ncbi:MAG: hypothetical protein O7F71_22960 [Gammaproteobacteria bacterium]|nr:hypothetical protein [Gammaproteobacteria bacterium]